jgi:hypothetical protein
MNMVMLKKKKVFYCCNEFDGFCCDDEYGDVVVGWKNYFCLDE